MLKSARILIAILSLAVFAGIIFFVNQQPETTEAVDSAKEASPEVVEPTVEVNEMPEPEAVVEPQPVVPETVADLPTPDRYAFHRLLSHDGREMEAQVLDVVDGTVYIRRHDKRIFKIAFDRFHPSTLKLLESWQAAYAHEVNAEQKAYLDAQLNVKPKALASAAPKVPVDVRASLGEDRPTGPYLEDRIKGVTWAAVEEMSDEFNGKRLDDDKWQAEPKGNGWNWLGRPPGLFRAENVRVEDGKMKVTVSKLEEPEYIQGWSGNTMEFLYQGAIVRSHHAGEPGMFFECKMKANATEMSSTFWLMTKGQTIKKLELDVQECVGVVSDDAEPWAEGWDAIYHSNMIHRTNKHNPEKVQHQNSIKLDTKNHERYYIYGVWWKSETEALFYLDGEHVYTIQAPIEWDVPAYIQMAIETYDWNPVPERGSMVEKGDEEERTTSYDWVRVWKAK
ncbi:family 16 glycosylhydrolase [Coraliomargarita akajimensis]|uniref:GH16 domain-containing protein n=1 Tax=Coraliomargarita akajimensis (strain DSM 45221 / IAM 15411 / JCM 23193 / KCTC 12865 / 04OKA010-24) TaxID=583355 RepID=D5EMJ8_CORAD|nr:family 16 glycosylhydrolase [Coraliomargarita akajimensis]ADE53404.1 hypothetical protein Caka_0379 [Coraliomargarita akajimensis DSM 45221]